MNKYILADMVTEKLKREIGMTPKPFPEELKTLEKVSPPEIMRFENALYQAEKLKKIAISKHSHGEGAGTVVMIAAEDEYDLPFVVVDVAFNFGKKGKIFAEFEAKPLVWDEESTRRYTDPFRKWREEIGRLPSEPITGFGESGEFLKAHHSQIHYIYFIPEEYTDKVLNLADQFFDIFVGIYRKAEPVEDVERRRKMDAFRSEYNRYSLDQDQSGQLLINMLGREKAQLYFEYFVNM